jgi:hypothetical protein
MNETQRIRKYVSLVVLALAVATGVSKADIGDTPASSEAKYGKGTLDLPRITRQRCLHI